MTSKQWLQTLGIAVITGVLVGFLIGLTMLAPPTTILANITIGAVSGGIGVGWSYMSLTDNPVSTDPQTSGTDFEQSEEE